MWRGIGSSPLCWASQRCIQRAGVHSPGLSVFFDDGRGCGDDYVVDLFLVRITESVLEVPVEIQGSNGERKDVSLKMIEW